MLVRCVIWIELYKTTLCNWMIWFRFRLTQGSHRAQYPMLQMMQCLKKRVDIIRCNWPVVSGSWSVLPIWLMSLWLSVSQMVTQNVICWLNHYWFIQLCDQLTAASHMMSVPSRYDELIVNDIKGAITQHFALQSQPHSIIPMIGLVVVIITIISQDYWGGIANHGSSELADMFESCIFISF